MQIQSDKRTENIFITNINFSVMGKCIFFMRTNSLLCSSINNYWILLRSNLYLVFLKQYFKLNSLSLKQILHHHICNPWMKKNDRVKQTTLHILPKNLFFYRSILCQTLMRFLNFFQYIANIKNFLLLQANLSLRGCLAMCLIFQENSGSRAYKLVAYKKKVY